MKKSNTNYLDLEDNHPERNGIYNVKIQRENIYRFLGIIRRNHRQNEVFFFYKWINITKLENAKDNKKILEFRVANAILKWRYHIEKQKNILKKLTEIFITPP